ncbi:metal-dependent hydrolase [Paenarthrobacter sp. PH39-S1]|uniref:metal-dependent hydrolase n=1 Tax=Paenarthrobacter sp. PH39-S1 TaxID=3046204 RepID=UPI0024BA0496|nr:metal-dependent hydrolase [Paenarthrobacter sp. PH39-S1]MDJ0356020.1 metal-dependent hydrolase [Paenarthrobacter sp. PH39-S1]
MTLPVSDTLVTYPAGQTSGKAVVLHTQLLSPSQLRHHGPLLQHRQEHDDGRLAVLLDTTPCHPVDAGWPDQGADRAVIRLAGAGEAGAAEAGAADQPGQWPVLDCVVAATNGQDLFIGGDIPVRKGTEGWNFVVVHLLPAAARLPEGAAVEVYIDADHRAALSAGHSACHEASLALNRALAQRWSKETRADALGCPDFNGAAIASSNIEEYGSVDVFRLNKSLRRKGFNADGLVAELGALTVSIDETLAGWVRAGAPVQIECDGGALTARRCWVCALPEGEARIPCGGTHVDSLARLGRIAVDLTALEEQGTTVLRMVTRTGAP